MFEILKSYAIDEVHNDVANFLWYFFIFGFDHTPLFEFIIVRIVRIGASL